MTVNEMMQYLDELVQAHPDAANYTVIRGNESEGYHLIDNEPTLARVENLEDAPFELEDLDSEQNFNVVVIS